MSYVLDVCKPEDVTAEDHIEDWAKDKLKCVIDRESFAYLSGLRIDYRY
jgi:Fe-S cluster assembly iron-binding protein IscA